MLTERRPHTPFFKQMGRFGQSATGLGPVDAVRLPVWGPRNLPQVMAGDNSWYGWIAQPMMFLHLRSFFYCIVVQLILHSVSHCSLFFPFCCDGCCETLNETKTNRCIVHGCENWIELNEFLSWSLSSTYRLKEKDKRPWGTWPFTVERNQPRTRYSWIV